MLKFATFTSNVELPFWASLASQKINEDKLDDSARRLLGVYEIRASDPPDSSCRLQIHGDALKSDKVPSTYYRAEGTIKNVNTIEEYQSLDKAVILTEAARNIWDSIGDGTILSQPSLLASFVGICFADVKRYRFTYIFAFPALHSDPAWRLLPTCGENANDTGQKKEAQGQTLRLPKTESVALVDAIQNWRSGVNSNQYGFFLAKRSHGSEESAPSSHPGKGVHADIASQSTTWTIETLSGYESGFFSGAAESDQFVGFADPSTYPTHPGWMLRNLLVLVRRRWKLQRLQVLCYRDVAGRGDEAKSIVLPIEIFSQQTGKILKTEAAGMPKVTGWERNSSGKIVSRVVSLGDYLDPQRLADQAVDLNLKLMKWRIAPSLDLDRIKNTKCLLLGAGTLGSYVSRNLLGWGVRKITFVDNGVVSYSNPVRQPLFKHSDCLKGGSEKAHQAATALREVYPGVDSQGFVVSVPMAGHPVIDESKTRSDFETLKRLINEHDAIFLLMDSRESRWLPTVVGKASGKLVMNAALGFDTFVVMRHGMTETQPVENELGCYFCNDVVAPGNSLSDRTLDQQCTVTRPGVAAIASALLVEIFVSVLQHPHGPRAPGATSERALYNQGKHPLGVVPHQVRGYLAAFRNILVTGKAYDSCSACSSKVLSTYGNDGWNFVKKALDEKGYVEEISGLAEVQRGAEQAIRRMEAGESDDTDDDETEIS